MYGECDELFFPTIMRFADRWHGKVPRVAEGGRKQLTYVGELNISQNDEVKFQVNFTIQCDLT